jgi:hypothetical protein
MCIAILNTPNVTFSKSLIRNCWENNGDGAGLIYTDTKRKSLHTFKELQSVDTFYNKYIEVRRKHPKSKIVLHFRISTSGGVNITNTHPFSVNDALAFVHNGVITELNGIDKQRSDTNLFNERVLKNLPNGFDQNETIAKLIGKYIGHSKLIFLNAMNQALIVNSGLGQEDKDYKGCWFSNSTYKPVNYYDYGGTKVFKPVTHYGWQKPDYKPQSQAVWNKPATPAVKVWDQKLQDWDTEAEEIYGKPVISTKLSPSEEMRLKYLRGKAYSNMTAKEWEDLNNLEMLGEDF